MKGKRASFVIPFHLKAAVALGRWLFVLRRRGDFDAFLLEVFCGSRSIA